MGKDLKKLRFAQLRVLACNLCHTLFRDDGDDIGGFRKCLINAYATLELDLRIAQLTRHCGFAHATRGSWFVDRRQT